MNNYTNNIQLKLRCYNFYKEFWYVMIVKLHEVDCMCKLYYVSINVFHIYSNLLLYIRTSEARLGWDSILGNISI